MEISREAFVTGEVCGYPGSPFDVVTTHKAQRMEISNFRSCPEKFEGSLPSPSPPCVRSSACAPHVVQFHLTLTLVALTLASLTQCSTTLARQ
jgi:hypothetical protein